MRITLLTAAAVTVATLFYAQYDAAARADERAAAALREAHTLAASIRPQYERVATGQADELVRALERGGWALRLYETDDQEAPRRVRAAVVSDQPQAETQPVVAMAFAVREAAGAPAVGVIDLSFTPTEVSTQERMAFWRSVWLVLTVALLVTLTVGWIARTLVSQRITKLLRGIDDVAKGDLSHVLLSDRDDEIGALAARFNDMTLSLRESRAETLRQHEDKLRLEQRLGQTEKLATIGQLAAEIAHEMGTPLNVIAGRAKATQKRAGDAVAAERNAQIIAEQAARVTRIIQRLVDFARRKVGTPANSFVRLDELASATFELLGEQFARNKIKNRIDVPDESPVVRGDADRLQQVLINLLMNAIGAMPDGGAVVLALATVQRVRPGLPPDAPAAQFACMRISDTGPGIPADVRERIFEAFYTTKGSGGTGLGLAVCQGIVKEHDGWIEISDASGGGTCIEVFVPIAAAHGG